MGDSDHPLSPPRLNIESDDFSRPRSASIQTRRSWPLLPTLEVTNSQSSNTFNPNNVISPIIDEDETRSIPTTSSDSESSTSSNYGIFEEKDTTFDAAHNNVNSNDNTVNDLNRRRSTLGGGTRRDSAGTLVEAALDQVEARDRHVRFPDHIAEAGSLVERMLSTKRPSTSSHHQSQQSHHTTIEEAAENDFGSIERQQTNHTHQSPTFSNNSNTLGGGSVLASLMKLESQRRQPSVKRRKTIKRKKVNNGDVDILCRIVILTI